MGCDNSQSDTGKGPPTLLYFHAFLHFCLLTEKKKNKKAEELPILLQDYKNQTGAENIFCAQVLSPSPGLKHLLTETENKALLTPDCAKTRSVQYL